VLPEERLPSGAPKEKFGRIIFQKKTSMGDRTKVPRQVLVEVRVEKKNLFRNSAATGAPGRTSGTLP